MHAMTIESARQRKRITTPTHEHPDTPEPDIIAPPSPPPHQLLLAHLPHRSSCRWLPDPLTAPLTPFLTLLVLPVVPADALPPPRLRPSLFPAWAALPRFVWQVEEGGSSASAVDPPSSKAQAHSQTRAGGGAAAR